MSRQPDAIPVPHRLREAVIAEDGFVAGMGERAWSVAEVRPPYTDPWVIRQPWLVCPSGAQYADHTFYRLFGKMRFRKILRKILRMPCTQARIASICPEDFA